ncbi:MATE family efflux transporter [Paenochrobactrum pullorum]|uniref:MATE family efflux transporter n=1 Tax=Paenochrobactrum pullorum TaxID=1324351 RepID=UPI0035BBDBE9
MRAKFRPYVDILNIAAPIIGIQFAQVALTSTDLFMMGFLGIHQVAAGGLALLLYNQLRTMSVGMVTSVGNMIAATVGRGENQSGAHSLDEPTADAVQNLLRSSMLLATLTAAIAALLMVGLGMCLNLLGQEEDIAALALPIMLTLAPGLIPMLWLNVLRQFAVGMRRAGSLMMVTLISVIINASLNLIFIFGLLGMPKLGLAGIGLSTTLVQLTNFLIYWRIISCDKQLCPLLAFNPCRATWASLVKIARMGLPISLTYGSEAAITSIATVLIGTFGPIALAASNIVNQLAYIVYQFNIGLSHGSSILVSRTFAQGNIDTLSAIAKRSFILSFSTMTLIALIYIFIPQAVLQPFIKPDQNPAVFGYAAVLLWFAIAHQFLKDSQNICIGLMRGLGNTRAGLTKTMIGYWLVGIPVMFMSNHLTLWGAYGIWGGLCLSFGVTSLLLWWQFSRQLQEMKTFPTTISSFI